MKINIAMENDFPFMRQKQVNLFHVPIHDLFQKVKDNFPFYQYHYQKHQVILENEHHEVIGYIRLPLHLAINEKLVITDPESLVLYLSIESGNAALCIMEGKENTYHTTFSAYMTRKKQGFSQIKYLNKKGKSRAGSRVRLASTVEFFEKTNTTLTLLFEEYEFARIAVDCPSTLTPYLHQSKIPCPFDKKDSRLYKIPLHIPQSNFTNLYAAIKKLMAPTLFFDEKNEGLWELFI